MKVSKNGIAVVVWGLSFVLTALGLDADPGTIEKGVEGVVIVIGLLLAIWNQLDRTDTKWFIFKK
jgi:hypothetical protein